MPHYLIGTDEAGYGPNLGPLVVTATMWRVPEGESDTDLYEALSHAVRRPSGPTQRAGSLSSDDARVEIGDSKQLYSAGSPLGRLELGVWSMFATLAPLPGGWEDAWDALAPGTRELRDRHPWQQLVETAFPQAVRPDDVLRQTRRLADSLRARQMELLAIRSRVIFPEEWNHLLERWTGKADVLSRLTMELIRQVMDEQEPGAVAVECDKHGGRNRYGPLIQAFFPDDWLEVIFEGRALSHYRAGRGDSRREFRFRMGGETRLPVALASMTSKYLRELAMQSFNHYWCSRLPQLRPTAGYPVDARRFYREIEPLRCEFQIADDVLWRRK
jgi:hypothetical protein